MESLYYQTLLDDKIKDYDVYISEESQVSEATAIEHLLKNKKYWGDMRIHYENLENKFQENCLNNCKNIKSCKKTLKIKVDILHYLIRGDYSNATNFSFILI